MNALTLHYIYDPLCGWCYAATPMVEAAVKTGIEIKMHGGGLWDPATGLASDKRSYIRQSDARIADLTGVAFGPAYLDGLLADENTVFWSRPTIAAVLAAGGMEGGADLRMMHAIQSAHYVDGRHVVQAAVLAEIAESIGLSRDDFLDALDAVAVDHHVDRTRRLMQQLGMGGFPSFALEQNGTFIRVQHEAFYGRPHAFLQALTVTPPASTVAYSPQRGSRAWLEQGSRS